MMIATKHEMTRVTSSGVSLLRNHTMPTVRYILILIVCMVTFSPSKCLLQAAPIAVATTNSKSHMGNTQLRAPELTENFPVQGKLKEQRRNSKQIKNEHEKLNLADDKNDIDDRIHAEDEDENMGLLVHAEESILPKPNTQEKSSLSVGAIAGISVGGGAILITFIVLVVYAIRKDNSSEDEQYQTFSEWRSDRKLNSLDIVRKRRFGSSRIESRTCSSRLNDDVGLDDQTQ